jgi:hypothetical protein
MKLKHLPILAVLSLGLASCASFQNASVADYNGDGIISDAEARQYEKQKNVEMANVMTENAKTQHAGSTVRTGANIVGDLSRTVNTLSNFGRW